MYLAFFRVGVYLESRILQYVVFPFQHLVHGSPLCRRLEMRSRFKFKFVGHVLALYFQHAVGVVAGDIAVEHVFHHAVVSELDVDTLSDLEGRLIDQPLRGTFLDDNAVLHDFSRQARGVLAFERHSPDDGGPAHRPFGKGNLCRADKFLVALVDFKGVHLRDLHAVRYLHRIRRISVSYGNPAT